MKKILFITVMTLGLFANTQPYKKDIVLEKVTKPTLVQVELDNEFYNSTAYNYRDVRLHGKSGAEGFFIKPLSTKNIVNQKTLTASSYDRENAKLTYSFTKPFEVETIRLNIEDRNFESSVDVYADGELVAKGEKIFDYSNETGTQNFTIKIKKRELKELTVVYHLDETTSFYKKYKNLHEMKKYLTIKSITFSNNSKVKDVWNRTEVNLDKSSIDKKRRESSYIFKTDSIPFSKIAVNVLEQNFKRSGQLYASEDAKKWHSIKKFSISASSLNNQTHKFVSINHRTNYLKLVLFNADNRALTIESLTLFTKPNYLYFIANPNDKYSLYFGDKNLTRPSYELVTLVSDSDVTLNAKLSKLERLEVTKVSKEVSFFEAYKEQLFIVGILLALGVLGYVAFGLLKRT
jgi:hypothetical protein